VNMPFGRESSRQTPIHGARSGENGGNETMSRRGASESPLHQLTIARGSRAEVVSSAVATAGASTAAMPSDAAAHERTTRRLLRTELNVCY
jgi:hypothetical protein